jgi:hypothetical protein
MELVLYVVILGLAINLMANMIWKYLPGSDQRVDAWITISIIIVCVIVIIARKDDPNSNTQKQTSTTTVPSYELVSHDSVPWQQLIREAKFRVYATGILASAVNEQNLVEKVKNNEQFQATLILLKPNGKFVGLRADDENMPRNPRRIADKLITFRELSQQFLSQEARGRLTIKCIDVYPTISVFIIDHDLYAYFYPYRAKGTSSPVIVFRNIDDNTLDSRDLATFFQRHFKAIDDVAKSPTTADYAEYEKLSAQK